MFKVLLTNNDEVNINATSFVLANEKCVTFFKGNRPVAALSGGSWVYFEEVKNEK